VKEGSSQDESLPLPIASSNNLEDDSDGDPCKSVECFSEVEAQKNLNSGQVGKVDQLNAHQKKFT